MAKLSTNLRGLASDLEEYENRLLERWIEKCAKHLDIIGHPISPEPEVGIVSILALVKIAREFEAIHRYNGQGDFDWGVMAETAIEHGLACDWSQGEAVLRSSGRRLFDAVLAEQARLAAPLQAAFGGAERLTYSLWRLVDCDDDHFPTFKRVFPGGVDELSPHMLRIASGYIWVLNHFDPPLDWS
jgi:hypothetical protein